MDRTVISATVPPEFAAEVKEEALRQGVSISSLIQKSLMISLMTERNRNEKERSKEKGKKKKELSPTPTARAREALPGKAQEAAAPDETKGKSPAFEDPEIENAAELMRPTEQQCIAAGEVAGVPADAVRRWLEHMRKFDWRFHSGGRVTIANFRTSLMKWWAKEKRMAHGIPESRAGGASVCGERKKPSWMTWEQWQFEEAERMANERRIEKVERVSDRLAKVRKDFGL